MGIRKKKTKSIKIPGKILKVISQHLSHRIND